MDDGSPMLEVGFAIDTGGSFNALTQLGALMDSTEAKIVREAKAIEQATGGMISIGGQTAAINAFASSTSAAFLKAEQAAERMTYRLSEQIATFGMTRAAAAAWRAEQVGATGAADELRAAEAALNTLRDQAALKTEAEAKAVRDGADAYRAFEAAAKQNIAAYNSQQAAVAAEQEAQALRDATFAYQRFNAVAKEKMAAYNSDQAAELQREAVAAKAAADEHARLAAMVRGSHDAQEADAAAAERLRESTDAVYAATKRVNAQLAESERLYRSGATAPAEYARQQTVLNDQLKAETGALGNATRGHQAHGEAAGLSRNATQELTHVLRASVDQLAAGAPPSQILTMHLAQLGQVASVTEGGVWGLTKALGGMVASVLPIVGPLAIVAGVAFTAFKQFQGQVKDSGELTSYRDSLGLTHKEMLQLSDGVDKAGDKIKTLSDVTVTAGDVMAGLWQAVKDTASASGGDLWDKLKSGAATAFGYVLEAWNAASAGITAGIYGTFNAVKIVWNSFPAVFGDIFVTGVNAAIDALNKLVSKGVDLLNGFIATADKIPGINLGQISTPTIAPIDNANAGAAAKAAKAIGDGYSAAYAEARKSDAAFWNQVGTNAKQHAKDRMKAEADALKENRTPKAPKVDHNALNAEAIEAQIKNLYKLADAYGVSGAAALIAEAREKAESKAIKSRADVEAAVAQQVRLAVAQRVADAAKAAASLNDQAALQQQVNAQVAAGLIPAALASQAMQERLALLPLLAAQEAARTTGDALGYAKATAALATLTDAQQRDIAAKRDAQYLSSTAIGNDEFDRLRLEAQLINATASARVHALAALKAEQEARNAGYNAQQTTGFVTQQVSIADKSQSNAEAAAQLNEQLRITAQLANDVADAFEKAFGTVGQSIGDAVKILGEYGEKQEAIDKQVKDGTLSQAAGTRASADLQMNSLIGLTDAAKNMFAEHSAGYEAMAAAEKALAAWRAIQAVKDIAAGAAKMFAALGPFGFAAVAAMVAVMAGFGISGGGGSAVAPTSSDDLQKAAGTGTVLGSVDGKSASIAHSLDLVAKNTDGLLAYSNPMLDALKTINTSIGTMTAAVAKQIGVSGSLYDTSKLNIGSSGSAGFLGLFSSSTTRTLYDAGITLAATTVGNIVADGIAGQTYQVVQQVKKSSGFLGIGGGTKTTYQTTSGSLPTDITDSIRSVIGALENGIVTAAGQIGVTGAKAMLDNFQVSIGQLSFAGLDAQGIEDELNSVFSKVGDQMVQAILPNVAQFQKAGEGLFETLERVASTVAVADAEFRKMGVTTTSLGIDVDMAVAGMFDSVSDFTSAADAYFKTYYSVADQAKAQAADMQGVFDRLGTAMPSTLAGFRQLVEAQDLTTTAGQSTYATLLKIAPAFADLQATLNGAKSAADALNERDGLLNQLWQLQGDTASIRAAQLATLDPSNRALQQQIYAVQDAQDAAKAAADLADAWKTVGDSIMDEINRIRGLDTAAGGSFASLMAQFNAATAAARGGDQTAAKGLPALSQSLLTAAAAAATSRQELDRVQAETAASLQATYDAIGIIAASPVTTSSSDASLLAAAATTSQASSGSTAANDDVVSAIEDLRADMAQMRSDMNSGNATIAGNTGKTAKIMDQVTAGSGGQAIAVANAA